MTGATGMVGGEALKACLKEKEVGRITSLVRRSAGIKHEKLNEVIVKDFLDYTGFEHHFMEVDLALYCLAVYQGKVSKKNYRTITVDYTEAFARILKKESPEAVFCLFSGAGAVSSEKSRMQFARDKGAAENRVFAAGFHRAHAFRPGYIYPLVKRKEPNFTYRITRRLYPLLKAVYPKGVITSEKLAKSMLTVGLKGGDQRIYENPEIKKIL
jgi:nucleoside-diphosphate-sugar epimerase